MTLKPTLKQRLARKLQLGDTVTDAWVFVYNHNKVSKQQLQAAAAKADAANITEIEICGNQILIARGAILKKESILSSLIAKAEKYQLDDISLLWN